MSYSENDTTAMPEGKLSEADWKRILNLLNEELDYWERESADYATYLSMISEIERQTGIKKKVECKETMVVLTPSDAQYAVATVKKKPFYITEEGPTFLVIALLASTVLLFYMFLITLTEGYRWLAAMTSVIMIFYIFAAGYFTRYIQDYDEGGDYESDDGNDQE